MELVAEYLTWFPSCSLIANSKDLIPYFRRWTLLDSLSRDSSTVMHRELTDTACHLQYQYVMRAIPYTKITLLKPFEERSSVTGAKKKKHEEHLKIIEKRRARALKRLSRIQDIEHQCEMEKKSWQNFNKKLIKTGKMRKSIFASPESNDGKVGVGTCGVSGKPMTSFTNRRHYLNN